MRAFIAIFAFILILSGVNWSIFQKEEQLANGDIAYLKLRPVDPRSLMQGDYMALRFEIADNVYTALPKNKNKHRRWRYDVDASDGYIVVALDNKKRASYQRLYTEETKLAENELKIRYRVRNGHIKFATNAFFFQEGTAKVYEKAKYGQFRVDGNGELLLAALFDKDLNRLLAEKN